MLGVGLGHVTVTIDVLGLRGSEKHRNAFSLSHCLIVYTNCVLVTCCIMFVVFDQVWDGAEEVFLSQVEVFW